MSEVKKYNAYAEGLTVHFELDSEGAWVAADDFDAQRLRADTAEAESTRKDKAIEDMVESNSDMTTCLAAAEQRIAELTAALVSAVEWFDDGVGRSHEEFRIMRKMRAALNPNHEAESHE